MRVTIFKISRAVLSFILFGGICLSASAADMSALDFNGNLLGKVIPDGSIININNELIGHITADGFAVDEENNLIGGIVPQGVAISNNNDILGKINNDGSVSSINDVLIGKTLPNGLVVNDNYDVLGAVISPGLVYDDRGKIIGRVSGDGHFYNLSGENNGFVTTTGYVYTKNRTDQKISLSGKIISAKIVISFNGKFLGSIAPDGRVIDLNKKVIGNIHANGFVFDIENKAIGHIVEEGYAFKFDGSYLGVVSYNGDIVNKGETVAHAVYQNRVLDKDGATIGYTISMSATANTLDGKYLGRIVSNGQVAKGRNVVGKIGASGNVINANGDVIGLINRTGPLFDYLGNLKANASVNGMVVSLDGVDLGYMQKEKAFDRRGKELARVLSGQAVYANNNDFIGISGINADLLSKDKKYTTSPYGYVFDENGQLVGAGLPFSNILTDKGDLGAYMSSKGNTDNETINEIAKLTASGILIDKNNKPVGGVYNAEYVTDYAGNPIGYTNPSNLVINKQNKITGKIIPNGKIVSISGKSLEGYAGNSPAGISINGDYLGSSQITGKIKANNEIIGRISSNRYVLDNMGAVYGAAVTLGSVISPECKYLGVVSESGTARNSKDAFIGTVLANNQVINETEEVIGYVINPAGVFGANGQSLGAQTPLGTVLNYNNQNLGCQDIYGRIVNAQKEAVGRIIKDASAMSFQNEVIGTVGFSGNIIDNNNRQVAYVGLDEGIHSKNGDDIGVLFQYKVAFDNNNTYLGRVNSHGNVITDNGNIIGNTNYNGAVTTNDGRTGYALYDLYVYDNEGKTVGYIAKNGHVFSIMGEMKGTIYQGFVLDKKQNLIARGARDFNIRNENKHIIGVLALNGQVIDNQNIIVGELGENGEILDADGIKIAQANPLQYYRKPEPVSSIEETPVEEKPVEEEVIESNEVEEIPDDTTINQNVVGVAVTPGGRYIGDVYSNNNVVDSQGNVIGVRGDDGEIINNNGDVVGAFQEKQQENKKAINSNWWRNITNGVTASPYNTNNDAVNVGPGGGIGPNGRYNPRRAEIIAQLQDSRRQSLSGKSIQNVYDEAAITGWQDTWDGIGRSVSTLRVDMSNVITADKPIPAVMARSLVSLGAAPVTAIVERNVYGDSGRNVIIPAGSRIIGGLDGDNNDTASSRFDGLSGGVKLDITWQRIVRPDGVVFLLNSSETGDAQGRGGGALGYVDEQLIKKYGMPILGTLATSAMSFMMAANEDATGEVETSKQQAASDARQQFIDRMDQILQEIIDNKSIIEPVTFVPAGTRIIIYPMVDLWLRSAKDIEKGTGTRMDRGLGNVETTLVDTTDDNVNTGNINNYNNQHTIQGNRSVNNRNQPETTPLIADDNIQQNNNNNYNRGGNMGAIPPPAADGTISAAPDYDEEVSGDIELF